MNEIKPYIINIRFADPFKRMSVLRWALIAAVQYMFNISSFVPSNQVKCYIFWVPLKNSRNDGLKCFGFFAVQIKPAVLWFAGTSPSSAATQYLNNKSKSFRTKRSG